MKPRVLVEGRGSLLIVVTPDLMRPLIYRAFKLLGAFPFGT